MAACVCYHTVFTSHFTVPSITFTTLLIPQENQYATVQLCVRIQSDSGGGNRLEVGATITLVAQEREESTPEVDGTSTSTDPPATSGEGPNTAPPLPPPRCKGDPVYTEAVVLSGSKTTVPPPSATDMVVYDDIQGFQNKDVHCIWLMFRAF